MRAFVVAILACCLVNSAAVHAMDDDTSAALAARVSAAIEEGRVDAAVDLLAEGKRLYPDSPWFPETLGDLYSERGLHSLALDEFLGAWKALPGTASLSYKVATAYAFLNRERESIEWLETTLAIEGDNVDAIGDLGWMMFKVHRLDEGIALLLDAGDRLGMNRSFSMTLGTLYSAKHDYDNAKGRYLEAIKDAERDDAPVFASIAYYNLSLLEERWYRFDEALALTDRSLSARDRSSGHLARGELLQRRLDYTGALEEYRKAYALDTSPLSKLNLADACLESGRLAEAERWLVEAERHPDSSWMANFGTDIAQFGKDVHDLRQRLHEAVAGREAVRPKSGFLDWLASLVSRIVNWILSWYHGEQYRKHSETTAAAYLGEGNELSAAANFAEAFSSHPATGAKYLRRAELTVTALVPKAGPSYRAERAILEGDERGMAEALGALDPAWERETAAETLERMTLAAAARGDRKLARSRAVALAFLNPGALPRAAIRLPARVSHDGSAEASAVARLTLSSFAESPGAGEEAFAVSFRVSGKSLEARLEAPDGSVSAEASIPIPGRDPAGFHALAIAAMDSLMVAKR